MCVCIDGKKMTSSAVAHYYVHSLPCEASMMLSNNSHHTHNNLQCFEIPALVIITFTSLDPYIKNGHATRARADCWEVPYERLFMLVGRNWYVDEEMKFIIADSECGAGSGQECALPWKKELYRRKYLRKVVIFLLPKCTATTPLQSGCSGKKVNEEKKITIKTKCIGSTLPCMYSLLLRGST